MSLTPVANLPLASLIPVAIWIRIRLSRISPSTTKHGEKEEGSKEKCEQEMDVWISEENNKRGKRRNREGGGEGRKSIWCWVELTWQEKPRDGGNLGNHIRLLLIYAFSQTGRE